MEKAKKSVNYIGLTFTVKTYVAFSVRPVLLAAYFAGGFTKQILVVQHRLRVQGISCWKAYGFFVA
jgi:hypothetical protein